MAEETVQPAEGVVVEEKSQKIMCFVSKQMVPLSSTIEIEYAPRKKVRVLPRYVKYAAAQ